MKSPYLTLKEFAELERIHPRSANRMARQGRVPGAQRHGRNWRINAAVYAKARGLTPEQLAA